jgi:hypothetical protein
MNYKKLTTRIVNTMLIAVTLGVIWYGLHMFAVAQDSTSSDQPQDAAVSEICDQDIAAFIGEERTKFTQFINTHFQSPKPTSELIPVAIERYAQYKKDLENEMARFKAPGESSPACQATVDEELEIERMLLREHITTNAYAKKTTRLMDKYKEINGKLEKLNFTIAQTYGYFAAMSQRLPCYTRECKPGM